MGIDGKKPSLGELILQHIIVFLICIAFPGALTSFVPATWLTFERQGDEVRCTTRTCVFFVVPFHTQVVEQVTSISQRADAGGIERKRQYGRTTNEYVHVEGKGYLQLHGEGARVVEVSVSPASLANVMAKCEEFLKSSNDGTKTIFAVANWKFGVLMGGVLTSFTALYVVGYSLELLRWIFKGFIRMVRGS